MSGLGAAFGPLLIVSLYSKSAKKYGALAALTPLIDCKLLH